MKQKQINSDHQSVYLDRRSTVMRAPIDQHHTLELTFTYGGDTQYRIVTRDIDNPE